MDNNIYYYMGGDKLFIDSVFSIDDVFKDTANLLFVGNQEEKDYYQGLQLMFGKAMVIDTIDNWRKTERQRRLQQFALEAMDIEIPLPFAFYATATAIETTGW